MKVITIEEHVLNPGVARAGAGRRRGELVRSANENLAAPSRTCGSVSMCSAPSG